MKRIAISLCIGIVLVTAISAQQASDYAVQVTAEVQTDPPVITLHWPGLASNSYIVHRKLASSASWGSAIANLAGTATGYTDSTISAGVAYEYRIRRVTDNYNGYGYLQSGIEVPYTADHGFLVLLVDSALTQPLATELRRLQKDIEYDGWIVLRHDITRTMPVPMVKQLITQDYVAHPGKVKSLFIVGHVAVPYSGEIAPDGHPNHVGAWPADVYYGDINGTWTDISVNNADASDERNRNVPGDGKFDQSLIPSDIELETGRIDFTDLPVMQDDAVSLTRRYLDRDHAFRMKDFTPEYRAVIDDNFGAFGGEAFASGGFRNFSGLVGDTNVISADYRTSLTVGSYALSYGCGGGSYTSCSGVGTSNDFAGDSLQTIFTMLFGSYFGDWDHSNNLMRVALAQGTTLTISWSGRPHWTYHPMGLGETVGYCARLTQNNNINYWGNYGMRFVHVALLGDPTLRLHYVSPPGDLNASVENDFHVRLNWDRAAEAVMGYQVYRRTDTLQPFELLSPELISDTTYLDTCLLAAATYQYLVRSMVLQHTPSGSYYNLSTGSADTAMIKEDHYVVAGFTSELHGDTLVITSNTSINATDYFWVFGDGTTGGGLLPTHVFQSPGSYQVTLVATNACDEAEFTQTIEILTGVRDLAVSPILSVYPNPAKRSIHIEIAPGSGIDQIEIIAIDGTPVSSRHRVHPGVNTLMLDDLAAGMYVIRLVTPNGFQFTHRFCLQ